MSAAATLKERLRADLKTAMRARATHEVRLLRTLIAALDNAEAVPVEGMHDFSRPATSAQHAGEVARRELDHAEVEALLASEADARELAAAAYERHGRPEDAARLRNEVALILAYRA